MSKKKVKECVCPVCNGTGKFELPNKMTVDTVEIKQRIILELHAKGYSIRQIQKALDYKSPQSVHRIIQQK
jgi:hypothetical protein